MIAEQDFILHIRRLHRLGAPRLVLGIERNLADYSRNDQDPDPTERNIRREAEKIGGDIYVMTSGDFFLILPDEAAKVKNLEVTLSNILRGQPVEPIFMRYALPANYEQLRARANDYMELARASEVMGPMRQAEQALQAQEVRGPLTAYSLSQVEKLLENIDVKRYVRTQPVYCQDKEGVWEKAFIDFFISIADLKKERFPRLNLATPERLFLELCCTLDRRLLQELTNQLDSWKDKKISLNLSAETVLSAAFAQFCHVLPKAARQNVSFDIHRSDIFLNFTATRNAASVLKSEGFKVGIDGITPSTLPYINYARFDVDYFKINVTREKWPELAETDSLSILEDLPREKLIFSHCDHEESLRTGQKLGVRYYQGWLIDDVANAIVH